MYRFVFIPTLVLCFLFTSLASANPCCGQGYMNSRNYCSYVGWGVITGLAIVSTIIMVCDSNSSSHSGSSGSSITIPDDFN